MPVPLTTVTTSEVKPALLNPVAYDPADHPEMLVAFLMLGRNRPEGFIEYANLWGPLGYRQYMESIDDRPPIPEGEPLRFYELHHDRLSWLANTIVSVKEGRTGPNWLVDVSEEANAELVGIRMRLQVVPSPLSSRQSDDWRRYGILPETTPPQGLRLNLSWQAPVHVLYWHLARWATGVTDMGTCEECQGYFVRTRKGQRYCPAKDKGFVSRRQSACGLKKRAKRFRARVPGGG